MALTSRLVTLAALSFVLAAQGAAAAPSPEERAVRLPGHVLALTEEATRIPRGRAGDELELTFVLQRTDQPGFERYLRDAYDPASPEHRRFLRPQEVADRFGPSAEAYAAVRRYLEESGLEVVADSANRLTLSVRGKRAEIERAFGLEIHDYRLGSNVFYANDRDPSLPSKIAARIAAISGLSNASAPQYATDEQAAFAIVLTCLAALAVFMLIFWEVALIFAAGALSGVWFICSGLILLQFAMGGAGGGGFGGLSLARQQAGLDAASDPSSLDPAGTASSRSILNGATGVGQTIGLLQFDTFHRSDIEDYLTLIGAPANAIDRLSEVAVNGGVATPGPGEVEVLLDVTTVMTLAPGANVVVYSAPFNGRPTSYSAIFNAMINDGVTVISNSWSSCENEVSPAEAQAIDLVLQSAAASGISVFNASGDTGSTCLNGSPNTVGVPASSPSATAVGGTSLEHGDGPTYGSENWWDGTADVPPTGQGGFGVSRHFPRPSFQDGLNGAAFRSVPDVAAQSDPAHGQLLCRASAGGCPTGSIYGGTSMAAPIWAALTAVLNERLGTNVGAMNTILYPLAGTDAFNDGPSLGTDFAHVGLGSPNPDNLHRQLSGEELGPVDPSASRVLAMSPTSSLAIGTAVVPADGATPGGILVRLLDAQGHPVSGKNVTLEALNGSAVIDPPSAVTSVQNAAAVFRVTNLTAETVDFVATSVSDGTELVETASITFGVPPPASGGITAFPTSVAANGTSTTTITVTLRDVLDRPTPGKRIRLSQGSGHSVIQGPNPPVTDANGQILFTATNRVNETVTYIAFDESDDDLRIPGSAQVTFSGGSSSCVNPTPPAGQNGYVVTAFATGFVAESFFYGNVNWGGCPGASNPAFLGDDVIITGFRNGEVYRLGPEGGAVSSANILSTLGPTLFFPAFAPDGRLYAAFGSTGGNFTTGAVVELDPETGAILRTLASNQKCPSGLAVDPLSGDLFFTHQCFGAGSDDASIHRIRNPATASPTLEVYATLPFTPNGMLAFAPNGTLYAAVGYTRNPPLVVRVAGTDRPSPPTQTQLAVPIFFALTIGEVGPDGDAISLMGPTTNGLELFDLTTTPFTRTLIATNLGAGVIGPDGCLYAGNQDTVYKVSRTDGACQFNPQAALPTLTLTPSTVSPNPLQGTAHELTATLSNIETPEGTPVFFEVRGANPGLRMVRADAEGKASFSYSSAYTGDDVIVATATVEDEVLVSNKARVTWETGRHLTFLTLNGGTRGGAAGLPIIVRASLSDLSILPPESVEGQTIEFELGDSTCSGVTDVDGFAECEIIIPSAPGLATLVARFAGTPDLVEATKTAMFQVTGGGTPLDPFMLYKVKTSKDAPKFVKLGPVELGNELGESSYDLLKAAGLALPANENGEGVNDAATHLASYGLKLRKGEPKFVKQPDVRVLNQCGESVLTLTKPVSLLVPTAKDLESPVVRPDPSEHEVDHFLCYAASAQKKLSDGTEVPRLPKGVQVDVADQFQTRRYDLKKVKWLCNPTSKSGNPSLLAGPQKGTPFPLEPAEVGNPGSHLLCYNAVLAKKRIEQSGCGPADPRDKGVTITPKQEKHAKRLGVHVANQLYTGQLDSTKESLLCLPSAVM